MNTSTNKIAIGNGGVVSIVLAMLFVMMAGLYMGTVGGSMSTLDECRNTGQVHFRNSWLVREKTVSCVKTPAEKEADALEARTEQLRKGTPSERVQQ